MLLLYCSAARGGCLRVYFSMKDGRSWCCVLCVVCFVNVVVLACFDYWLLLGIQVKPF